MTQYLYPMRSPKIMRQELEDANIELELDDNIILAQRKEIEDYRRLLERFSTARGIVTVRKESRRLLKKYKSR